MTFYYKTSNPLSSNFNFTKIRNSYFQTIKPKITTQNSYFERYKWYKRASFHLRKTYFDCSSLRYHQSKRFALNLLHKFFDINYMFFYEFLICLMMSIQINVMLFVQINQNLDHMMDLNIR